MESLVGHQMDICLTRRKNTAGSNNVKGTLVRAPINATKSLKKGTALETKKAMTAMTPVSIIHRTFGRLFNPNSLMSLTNNRSTEEQMACELMA